ncbi:hypothetical protein [Nostoc sp. WHI]|uniref:hypothetical protein n=1 Tax=Nostoc sp. WHI TaxID=2650611 RepID=UPI0018C53A4B|nr:hypothetical protein [Nostoc sp. WHI]
MTFATILWRSLTLPYRRCLTTSQRSVYALFLRFSARRSLSVIINTSELLR